MHIYSKMCFDNLVLLVLFLEIRQSHNTDISDDEDQLQHGTIVVSCMYLHTSIMHMGIYIIC